MNDTEIHEDLAAMVQDVFETPAPPVDYSRWIARRRLDRRLVIASLAMFVASLSCVALDAQGPALVAVGTAATLLALRELTTG